MAKPTPKPEAKYVPSAAPKTPPAKRVRVIQNGSNNYDVIVEEYAGPPTKVTALQKGVARTVAIYEVRLFLEEYLGPDRVADSGL